MRETYSTLAYFVSFFTGKAHLIGLRCRESLDEQLMALSHIDSLSHVLTHQFTSDLNLIPERMVCPVKAHLLNQLS